VVFEMAGENFVSTGGPKDTISKLISNFSQNKIESKRAKISAVINKNFKLLKCETFFLAIALNCNLSSSSV